MKNIYSILRKNYLEKSFLHDYEIKNAIKESHAKRIKSQKIKKCRGFKRRISILSMTIIHPFNTEIFRINIEKLKEYRKMKEEYINSHPIINEDISSDDFDSDYKDIENNICDFHEKLEILTEMYLELYINNMNYLLVNNIITPHILSINSKGVKIRITNKRGDSVYPDIENYKDGIIIKNNKSKYIFYGIQN